MATANRMITTTEVTHVSVMVSDQDIKMVEVEHGLRVLTFAGVHIYLDENGVTKLLERLLLEPEAIQRTELLPELHRVADYQQARVDDDVAAQAV